MPFLGLELKTDQQHEKDNEISPTKYDAFDLNLSIGSSPASSPLLGTIGLRNPPSGGFFAFKSNDLHNSPHCGYVDCSSNCTSRLYQHASFPCLSKPYSISLRASENCTSRLYQQRGFNPLNEDSAACISTSSSKPERTAPKPHGGRTRLSNDAHKLSWKRISQRHSGLTLRGATFYARWIYPRALWRKVGTTHFVKSLKTKDINEAKQRLKLVGEEFENIILAAEGAESNFGRPDFGPSQSRPTHQPVLESAKTKPKTFEQVFVQFLNDPTRKRAKKTLAGYRDAIDVIYSVIPQSTPIVDIDRDACRDLLETLQWLPSNASKRFPNMDAKHAAKMAKERGIKDRLGPVTINTYMLLLSSILNFAINEEMIDRNPCRGLRMVDPVKKKDKRLPFSKEQLRLIFDTSIYRENAEEHRHTAKFWVPQIALHTGARLNEICALNVSDIQTIEGILCILIRQSADKSVKTEASERVIPVPNALLDLGFADLVAFRWNAGNKKLFPELPLSKNGHYSVEFSKWFGRHIRAISAYRPRTCFHSFRHNFRDALREAKVDTDIALALGGWSREGRTGVHTNYGQGYSISTLKEAIDSLDHQM